MSQLEGTLEKDDCSPFFKDSTLGPGEGKDLAKATMTEKVMVSTFIWLVCEDRGCDIFK